MAEKYKRPFWFGFIVAFLLLAFSAIKERMTHPTHASVRRDH